MKRSLLARATLFALVAAAMAVHVWRPTGAVGEGTYLVVGFGASAAAWLGARRAPAGSRRIPVLIATGVTVTTLGDLAYYAYGWMGQYPDVSLADIPWFATYAALAAALLLIFVRPGGERVNIDAAIDGLTVVTVSVLLFWELSIEAIVSDTSLSPFVRAVWAGYPVADAVLLALVLRAVANRRTRAAMGASFALGVVCWLATDIVWLTVVVTETGAAVLDIGWLLGALLMAGAAWRIPPGERAEAEPEAADRGGRQGLGQIALAIVPLTVPPLMGLHDVLLDRSTSAVETAVATGVVLALAFVRTARLLRSEQRARAEARRSHRHYARLAANSSDAVIVIDQYGHLTKESPPFAALVGLDGPCAGLDAMALLAPVEPEELRALFGHVLASPNEVFETEALVRTNGVTEVWLGARLVNALDDPDVEGVIVALHDISDRKRIEGELAHQAFHDGLTGLPNRALYRERVEHSLRLNARTGLDPAVLYLDLDGFKMINDSLGHDAGDDLLRQVAERLQEAVRSEDTVARLGGDEFAILVEQSRRPLDDAIMIADRILERMDTPFDISGSRVSMFASIGIATGDAGANATALIRNADIAMYRAKATGKARWVVYDPGMRVEAVERVQLENDLDGALERGEFQLVYQPVVRLETREVVGFEALLRWHHPRLGVIGPDRFIPIAEECGFIVAIGAWVLRTACEVGARWQREYPIDPQLTIAVNLSARQLAADSLVGHVTTALEASALEPQTLVLEMTETVLIDDPPTASRRLHQLRELGVRLAIDDFGTGYSSLSYLRQFPIDILKIDRSFINTITDRKAIPAIVRGLLELGRTLELETIAEGVEDHVQLDGLRDEHCQLAQGFLFARPLDPVDAEALLAMLTTQPSADRPAI